MRGWGSPNSDDWRKSLALCLLSGFIASNIDDVAQLVERRLVVRQARVRFLARHPIAMGSSLAERISGEDSRRQVKAERMYELYSTV